MGLQQICETIALGTLVKAAYDLGLYTERSISSIVKEKKTCCQHNTHQHKSVRALYKHTMRRLENL